MEENFLCRFKKCPDNLSGRIFPTSRGFVGHYRISHGDTEEGRRQVRLQRMEAQALADKASEFIVNSAVPKDRELAGFDETGEPSPEPITGESARAAVGEIESFLTHHVAGLTRELESVKQRVAELHLEEGHLEELLKRAQSALTAYKQLEK